MTSIHHRILGAGVYALAARDGATMGSMSKSAAFGVDSIPAAAEKSVNAVLIASLLFGVPTGVAAHIVTQAAKRRSAEELELKGKIKYYNEATQGLSQALKPATEDVSNVH